MSTLDAIQAILISALAGIVTMQHYTLKAHNRAIRFLFGWLEIKSQYQNAKDRLDD